MTSKYRMFLLLVGSQLLAVVAWAQPPATPEARPGTNKRGTITGQVIADDGQPLIGAGVNAVRPVGERTIYRPAATDEEGKFKITDLPVGSYLIMPQVNGYVMANSATTKARYHLGDNVTLTLVKGGVITGKALDSAGQPLVGATVSALRVRDGAGRVGNLSSYFREALTDDRGSYRIYGLEAGSYLVSVGGGYGVYYNDDVKESPTYHPNSTRDTAQEVNVQPGLVVQGIDIRHHGERGHAISGTFAGLYEAKSNETPSILVRLTHAATGTLVTQTYVSPRGTGKNSFALYGIADGEYQIAAQRQIYNRQTGEDGVASTTRKVVVRGGDVTGIELRLLALASIAGRVALEPEEKLNEKRSCSNTRRGTLEEVIISYQRDETETRTLGNTEIAPDEKSEFKFQDMLPGRYRLTTQLPSEHWFVKAMTLPATAKTTAAKAPATKPNDVARSGLTLKSGENLTGLAITIADGAAGVSGHIVVEKDKPLPPRVRVHLVPAEKEAADDSLRYAEVVAKSEGVFTFTNLAPGKYWLLTRVVPEDESEEQPAKPAAWDTTTRVKLRIEAEAANTAIELMPCLRVKDYALRFTAGK
jgi:hypothetical protein